MKQRPTWFYKVRACNNVYAYETGLYETYELFIPTYAHNKEEAYNKVKKKYGSSSYYKFFIFNDVQRITRTEFRRLKQNIPEG